MHLSFLNDENDPTVLSVEGLEDRNMLSSVSLTGGTLVIQGGTGDDTIELANTAGNESFTVDINNDPTQTFDYADIDEVVVFAGEGNDLVVSTMRFEARIYGGDGNDRIEGSNSNDQLFGGRGNDQLYGGGGNDVLRGGDGNDRLFGNGGNDSLYGQIGADTLYGNDGDDRINAGFGNDTVVGGVGNDVIVGFAGENKLYGNAGNDRITGGRGSDDIIGGGGNDWGSGGAGVDRLMGNTGNDRLFGGAGEDFLFGFEGVDYLDGQSGDDYISGGDDDDILLGGTGDDRFHISAGDDRIDGGGGTDELYNWRWTHEQKVERVGASYRVTDLSVDSLGSDLLTNVENIFNPYIARPIDDLVWQPVTERVYVQPVVLADADGSNRANFMGNPEQEAALKRSVDAIFNQAGIDVEWLDESQWNNTGVNNSRPNLSSVISNGHAYGGASPDPLVVDMYFVSENRDSSVSRMWDARVGSSGSAITVADGSLDGSWDGSLPRVAIQIAHQIAHNLGLEDTSHTSLMAPPGCPTSPYLDANQIQQIQASSISQPI